MATMTKQEIEAIDRLYHSPQERAEAVHQLIWPLVEQTQAEFGGSPTVWDVLCWAVEYVNIYADSAGYGPIVEKAKELTKAFYSIHYNNAPQLYGKPEKEVG